MVADSFVEVDPGLPAVAEPTAAEIDAWRRVLGVAASVLGLGRFYSEDQPRDENGRWGEGSGGSGGKEGDGRSLGDYDRNERGMPVLPGTVSRLEPDTGKMPKSGAGVTALKDYQGFGYEKINGELRERRDPDANGKAMTSLIAKSQLAEDVTVYRSMHAGAFSNFGGMRGGVVTENRDDKEIREGVRFVDRGFTSTDTHGEAALVYADHQENVLLAIKVPAGSQAVFNASVGHNERELVIQRGSTFEVGKRIDVSPGDFPGRDHVREVWEVTVVAQRDPKRDPGKADFATSAGGDAVPIPAVSLADRVSDWVAGSLILLDDGQTAEDPEVSATATAAALHTHGHCKGCGAWLEGRRYCRKCGDGYDGPLLEAGSEAPEPDPPYNHELLPDTMAGTEDAGGGPGGVDQEDDPVMTTTASNDANASFTATTTNGDPAKFVDAGTSAVQAADLGLSPWRGVIAVEGKPTGDGRMFRRGSLYWDEGYLPADVFVMFKDPEGGGGHDGSLIAGQMRRIWKEEAAGYVEVWAEGVYDTGSDAGREVLRLQRQGMLTGVSVDVDAVEVVMPDVTDEDTLLDLLFGSGVEEYSAGRIRRVTVCSIPAFIEARIFPVDDAGALVASAAAETFRGVRSWLPVDAFSERWAQRDGSFTNESVVLTASATAFAVAKRPAKEVDVFRSALVDADPPVDVFARVDYREYTPFTVDADGRVSGHVSPWGACHIGFTDRCVPAPKSSCGYAHARTGHVLTAEGDLVATARVFAQFGPGRRCHAPEELAAAPTVEWYESMCLAVADVAVYEDAFGIQAQGRVRPGVTRNQVVALRASRISPDWRTISGRLECVGLAVVNVSGFTNAPNAALVASALGADVEVQPAGMRAAGFLVDGEVQTLVAMGAPTSDPLSDAVAGLLARVDELEQAEFRRQAEAVLAGVPSADDDQARFEAEVAAILDGVDLAAVSAPDVTVDDSPADVVDDPARRAWEALSDDARTLFVRALDLARDNAGGEPSGEELADDPAMQTCPHCGADLSEQDIADGVCPVCGWKLAGATVAATDATVGVTPASCECGSNTCSCSG